MTHRMAYNEVGPAIIAADIGQVRNGSRQFPAIQS
jgi:hypothetical protein